LLKNKQWNYLLKKGEINIIIVTRPTVSVDGEEVGFLPGSIVGKMDPWTRPIFDVFLEGLSKSELDELIYNNVIEISPLGFMRGRTFKNAFIIADEMQNSSPSPPPIKGRDHKGTDCSLITFATVV